MWDDTVLDILQQEQYDFGDRIVEYWFQSVTSPGPSLGPHCDYNFIYRQKMKLEGSDWPHRVPKDRIVSPVTIAAYLEVQDLQGGELAISHRTWYDESHPDDGRVIMGIKETYPFETFKPNQGDVVYFRGSEHYHWIQPTQGGRRRSMLINFWPADLYCDVE